jgi:hypothetical protein
VGRFKVGEKTSGAGVDERETKRMKTRKNLVREEGENGDNEA